MRCRWIIWKHSGKPRSFRLCVRLELFEGRQISTRLRLLCARCISLCAKLCKASPSLLDCLKGLCRQSLSLCLSLRSETSPPASSAATSEPSSPAHSLSKFAPSPSARSLVRLDPAASLLGIVQLGPSLPAPNPADAGSTSSLRSFSCLGLSASVPSGATAESSLMLQSAARPGSALATFGSMGLGFLPLVADFVQ